MTGKNDTTPGTAARTMAGAIALIALANLGLQTTIGTGSLLENAAGLLRFFTIWSNCAAALLMGAIAAGKTVPRAVMAALATALSVVSLVYWMLLAVDHHPVGLDVLTNQIFHTFVPAATFAWWLKYTPRAPHIIPLLPVIMVPPLSYGAFAFVLGEATGFYAYFFLDLPELGWAMFLANNVGLALFFALVGTVLLAFKNLVNRFI